MRLEWHFVARMNRGEFVWRLDGACAMPVLTGKITSLRRGRGYIQPSCAAPPSSRDTLHIQQPCCLSQFWHARNACGLVAATSVAQFACLNDASAIHDFWPSCECFHVSKSLNSVCNSSMAFVVFLNAPLSNPRPNLTQPNLTLPE